MRIAYWVTFNIATRVVVNTEKERKDEEEHAMNAAIKKILTSPDEHIITDNITTVNEDKECPAGTFKEE